MDPDFCYETDRLGNRAYSIGSPGKITSAEILAAPADEAALISWGDLANWALRAVRGGDPRLALGVVVDWCL